MTVKLDANLLADNLVDLYNDSETANVSALMLRQQAKQIEDFRFVLRNLTLATSKKIGDLEEELEGCTCQGGHSEAYLKIKGKL
jgi:hypothetical protein